MTVLFQDSFDVYGVGAAGATNMLQGVWAEVGGNTIVNPAVGARTGSGSMRVNSQSGGFAGARLVLPVAQADLYVTAAFYIDNLPVGNDTHFLLGYRDSANIGVGAISLQADGSLRFTNAAGATLVTTAANVFTAGSWISIQTRYRKSVTVGVAEIRVNNVTVATFNGDTGATTIGMIRFGIQNASTDITPYYVDDLVVNSGSGTYNSGYPGDVRVATLYLRADDTPTGWTARPRALFGAGILQLAAATNDAITCADSADFELGSGDYTMEAFCRFTSIPTGTAQASIFSKWRSGTNERSYQLFLGGNTLNGGRLEFRRSTDGQAGTDVSVVSSPFVPIPGRWYHICVQRASGVLSMFVDGLLMAAPTADAVSYYDSPALMTFGAQQNGATSILANTTLEGFMEEVRMTKGVARYGSGFPVPTAAYGRTVGTDTSYNSVVFLAGFDNALLDEGPSPKAITARGNAARFAVDDTQPGKYKTANQIAPRDDTYVEAPFTSATGTLTLTATPLNGETVTTDSKTYTFNTVLGAANSILIGANANASLDNLTNAINGGAGIGVTYGTGTTAAVNTSAANIGNNQMRVTANISGTGGNALATTETLVNGAWSAATLTGGLAIPAAQAFLFDRLPAQTTGVRAVTLLRRARKTDSGPGTVQSAFVSADNSSANGAATPLTTSFAYYADIIEQDPSTSGALTPTSFLGARVRVDRTA